MAERFTATSRLIYCNQFIKIEKKNLRVLVLMF